MALIQILNNFYRNLFNKLSFPKKHKIIIQSGKPIIWATFFVFFSVLFFVVSNLINHKNTGNQTNLKIVANSNEFSNLSKYFISKINSPYVEVKYLIKNNDSVEKILRKFNIKNKDIKKITTKLKQKKLSNIYSGRELSLIYKKLDNNLIDTKIKQYMDKESNVDLQAERNERIKLIDNLRKENFKLLFPEIASILDV